jgi:uncharacterized phage-associated protein
MGSLKMSHNPFNFDHEKATQILNFFASKAGGKINKMKALKLIFLADRYHLRKYGRLVSDDCYVAMKYGPVPSTIMDIAEADEYLDNTIRDYVISNIRASDDGLRIESLKPADTGYFSASDIEAFIFAWDNFGQLDQWGLSDFTHNYPEWLRHKDALQSGSKAKDITLEDFLNDPDTDNIDKCYELNDQERDLRRKQLAENIYLESLWR